MEHANAQWEFFFTKLNEKPHSISLDLDLEEWPRKHEYPWLAKVYIYLQKPDENGFPTNAEHEILCDIEDQITDKTAALSILAGKVKGDGRLILFFYAQQEEGLEVLIESAIPSGYEYAVQIEQDTSWNGYTEYLYPDAYDYKAIMNMRVLRQLEQQGDKLETAREIDHWAYFKNEGDANHFLQSIAGQAFKKLSVAASADGVDYPTALNFSRIDEPQLPHINNITWYLMDKAEESGGRYDGWGCPVIK